MKKTFYSFLTLAFLMQVLGAQVTLSANGEGNTYEEINAVLAPGHDVVEVPDCVHTSFGRHIDELFDSDLGTNVFRFIAHVTPDNDRCINFDRQRIEIKTYGSSPDNLKAVEGETVEYKWKFKLANGFQPSTSFTHIHQIKAVGGPYASIPMITLTVRKASVNRIELRYTPTNNQNTIAQADLSLFEGHWVEVTELITYDNSGSYSIEIKKISNGQTLLSYSNTMDTWQDGADFSRPKWGIYRSLNNTSDLRDEEVLFNDFSIEELSTLSLEDLKKKADTIILTPNPAKTKVSFKNANISDYDEIQLFDSIGKTIDTNKRLKRNTLDVSGLSSGLYYISFNKSGRSVKVLKCVVE